MFVYVFEIFYVEKAENSKIIRLLFAALDPFGQSFDRSGQNCKIIDDDRLYRQQVDEFLQPDFFQVFIISVFLG